MRVKVRTLRKEGRNLVGEELQGVPKRVGILLVREARDIELNRAMVCARLLDPASTGETDLLPMLSDAHLMWAEKKEMRLTGIERLSHMDVAQTWSVEFDGC